MRSLKTQTLAQIRAVRRQDAHLTVRGFQFEIWIPHIEQLCRLRRYGRALELLDEVLTMLERSGSDVPHSAPDRDSVDELYRLRAGVVAQLIAEASVAANH